MSTPSSDPEATARVDSDAPYTPRSRSGEAQFAPGTMVAGRYRIASILGSGGMGEVYRADDVKLGQTVALKFLPARLAHDPTLLDRLHDEVRLGRQIAHPNVCRIYDIVEWADSHFVAMEYVDGEDLSRLLKRIGRLANDKAVDIARGMAAGLAAAHAKGILHRDLKPANVMIDSLGEARLMDFGLALAAGEDDGTISGTPAYMAPEQFDGEPATVQSDLYALGLVMYELFTGKRAHSARTVPERVRDLTSQIATPSTVIRDLDPAVERVILRCLSNDPAQRPSSARDVIQALPGGDPLAAALAAGDTPSPRAVAAAGTAGSLKPAVAWALLVAVVAMVGLFVGATVHGRYWQRSGLTRPPEVEAERARDLLRRLGVPEQPFRAGGFTEDVRYAQWIATQPERPKRLGSDFTYLRYWMREESEPIVDARFLSTPQPAADRPPQSAPGSTLVEIDPAGRLLALRAVASPAWQPRALDWPALLRAGGFDPARLAPAEVQVLPPTFADARAAWSGRHPRDGTPVRIEAAAFRGVPVMFRVIGPWDDVDPQHPFAPGGAVYAIGLSVIVIAIAAGVLLAWRNLRQRRGDRTAAVRIAIALFVLALIRSLAAADHEPVLTHELSLLALAIGEALFAAGLYSLLYLALEPYIRRRWPQGLISWVRLVSGNWRDAMVGRDVLIGVLGGLLHAAIPAGIFTGQWLEVPFSPGEAESFNSSLEPLARVAGAAVSGIMQGLAFMIVLMLFMIVSRRRLFAAAGVFALMLFAYSFAGRDAVSLLRFAVLAGIMTLLIAYFGLLATVVAQASFHILMGVAMPDALDWYTVRASTATLLLVAAAIWAFRTSLGGRPAFAASLDD